MGGVRGRIHLLTVPDLVVLYRMSGPGTRGRLLQVPLYVFVAITFGIPVSFERNDDDAASHYTAYITEPLVSGGDLFVLIVIFPTLSVPANKQHRVLFHGIIGAVLFRAASVFAGTALSALSATSPFHRYIR